MEDFEKLGLFYLGRRHDTDADRPTEEPVLYDSRDLTTHAVIIGMTGSGKTGLGIALIEEAALDRIPVIAIDPKGDLGNLLLTFPALAPEDFEPWIDPRAAAAAGRSPAEHAAAEAAAWREGLAAWGQTPERIARLRAAADFALYTPGSTAGTPLSLLREFAAPPPELLADAEPYRERLQGTVTGLLALAGLAADPLGSREHILLATLLDHAWRQRQSPDLAALIGMVQRPPVAKLGALDLESAYPAADRHALALRLNNLLAAPGFEAWVQGEPLDADRLLFTREGRPRVSVISIAHLDDAARMAVVTLLLAEIIAWMRRQSGTPALRAILYMDEMSGYVPPVAKPPSKPLFLELLKQARAFGVGVVLATQNPVDLDYKGLANAGTWFLGRMQTERDRARVLEGLAGAAGAERLEMREIERLLAGLGKRQFLLHDVHEERPVVFSTRHVMSYLAGPLTRAQIRRLGAGAPPAPTQPPDAAAAPAAAAAPPAGRAAPARPVLPPGVGQLFVPAARLPQAGERLVYRPRVLAAVAALWSDRRHGIHEKRELVLAGDVEPGAGGIDWARAEELPVSPADLEREPEPDAHFLEPDAALCRAGSYAEWEKQLRRAFAHERALVLYECPALGAVSASGESERDFRIRLQQLFREKRDLEAGRLRQKYQARLDRLVAREQRAVHARERQSEQARDAKLGAAVAIGAAVLGAFLGRGRPTGSATRVGTAVRRTGSIARESGDVRRAEETLEQLRAEKEELHAQLQADLAALDAGFDAQSVPLEKIAIRPRAGDVDVRFIGIGWVPYIEDAAGELRPA